MTQRRFENRVALVTGATRGIGRATALALAAEGAHVVALGRTQGALEELDDEVRALGANATLVPLDLRDGDALDRLGAALHERHGRLDALVGNAAILGPLSPLSHVSPKQWDEVLAINVTANWRLIRSLDALIRQSDAGRAVFVSSGAAESARAFWGPYAATKAALEAMIKSYADELAVTRAKVNLFRPGVVATRMRAQAMPGEDPATLAKPEAVAPHLVDLVDPGCSANGELFDFRAGRLLRVA